MNEFLLIAGMAGITFSIRYLLLGVGGRIRLSEKVIHLLRYVPPAVLTAIVVPAVLMPTGDELMLAPNNARLIGAIVAVVVSYRTQNLLLTIGLGMAAFFLGQWFLQG
ncbi:AzlD domain-containing protein [Leptolyngbya ohadii]|uniref:AzlD domain-containing protein n=1 Tax=Leptolyngbya ohadii TaxID=1962290 RepID=UPI000B59D190|nr:AzlD domain-containing protein [Leptolyngbya ohadii]